MPRKNKPLPGRGSLFSGFNYLLEGARLLRHPQIKAFVLIPVLINSLLFIVLTILLVRQFESAIHYLMEWLPGFLDFLAWIVGVVLGLFILMVYGYCFSAITNLLAAPFYGVLAERVEQLMTGRKPSSEPLLQLIPRTFGRECEKLWYFLWRSLLILLLSFVPLIGPALAIGWATWCMAVQYSDYAADNNQVSFAALRTHLQRSLWSWIGFGGGVMLGLMVPFLNIIVVPAAVAGGTLFWLRELDR